MVIVLDSSGSITRKQFKIEKKFATDLVKRFEISNKKTNVALAAFSQYTQITRTFQNNVSLKSVLKAIDELHYEGAASRLDLAFDVVKFTLLDTRKGARDHTKGVKRVAVFLTDGYSTRGVEFTKDSAAELREKKAVHLFSVGISDRVHKVELDEIANKPHSKYQMFANLTNNSVRKEQTEHFAKIICES